jgi:Cytochrome c3
VCALLGRPGGEQGTPKGRLAASDAPPPLTVEENAPQLNEPSQTNAAAARQMKSARPTADNSTCYVCHFPFKEDSFVLAHARANIGCAKCHGNSRKHVADENNLTPPDIMFPAATIVAFCSTCHKTHDAPAVAVLTRWKERCADQPVRQIVCTDCHGDHHMQHRTIRWDKRTGRLTKGW